MDLWQSFVQLVASLWALVLALIPFVLRWSVVIAWLAWALWAVNWRKTWPVLARGGWAPFVLLVILIALAWSQIWPTGDETNFWWQLGVVCAVAAATLFCGWLQEVFRWTPPEIELEPPAAAAGHEHHEHH